MGRPCKTLSAVVIRERDDCEFSFPHAGDPSGQAHLSEAADPSDGPGRDREPGNNPCSC